MSSDASPYISIVATARNDDHGGNLLGRVQIFMQSLIKQSSSHQLPIEIVLVEWNPVPGKKRLREALEDCEGDPFCNVRYIEVPEYIHCKYNNHELLPLFQMIAKNAGVRRARAPFILCTNIDILFSEILFSFLARRELEPSRLYRAERCDIDINGYEDKPAEGLLIKANDITIRRHALEATFDCRTGYRNLIYYPKEFEPANRSFDRHIGRLFTNASGDMQLMDRESWLRLGGYPEFEMYSMHLDSFLEFQAIHAGIVEEVLPTDHCTYHIEHTAGFTPETKNDGTFQKRFAAAGMMEYEDVRQQVWQMHYSNHERRVNGDDWGLANISLPEYGGEEKLAFTIICTPKPFTGDLNRLQRNAIRSWQLLDPGPEIILVGDEEGYAKVRSDLGLRHEPEIDYNRHGTPLVSSIFKRGCKLAKNDVVAYVNSDIILFPDFVESVRLLLTYRLNRFLIIGERRNLEVLEDLSDATVNDFVELHERCRNYSVSLGPRGIDYFVFKKGMFADIPEFALGRTVWDQWLVWDAFRREIPVIDASSSITALHQTHNYNHVTGGFDQVWYGEDAERNRRLAKGRLKRRHIGNSNFLLADGKIHFKANQKGFSSPSDIPPAPKTYNDILNISCQDLKHHQELIFSVADDFYEQGEYKQAFRIYHRLALDCCLGDAMMNLAEMSARGLGSEKDIRLTAYWFRQVSKCEYICGNNHYGIIFENRKGGITPIDYWKKEYESDSGDLPAFLLGISWLYGYGVPVDIDKALFWFGRCSKGRAAMAPLILCYELEMREDLEMVMIVRRWLQNNFMRCPEAAESYLVLSLRHAPDMLDCLEEESIVNRLILAGRGEKVVEVAVDCILGRYPNTDRIQGERILQIGCDLGDKDCIRSFKQCHALLLL